MKLTLAAFALGLGISIGAQGATVTFSSFSDATGKFGVATPVGDTLGVDVSAFKADTSSLANNLAFDTIAFTVNADAGFKITSITYTESGTATTDGTSFAAASATWVVNNVASSLGFHVFPQNSLNATFTLSSPMPIGGVLSLPVSITNNLFASGISASIQKTSASIEVTTAPLSTVPEPSAVVLLLAGLGGVVALAGRRRRS